MEPAVFSPFTLTLLLSLSLSCCALRQGSRLEWITGSGLAWDEGLLALALRIQRSANFGAIARGGGLNALLGAMAAGQFGALGRAQASAELLHCLREWIDADGKEGGAADAPEVAAAAMDAAGGDEARATVARVLLRLGFVKDGL